MKRVYFFTIICTALLIFSCAGIKDIGLTQTIDRKIESEGIKSAEQLTAFFVSNNPSANKKEVFKLAKYYVKEAAYEGINSDVAFVQMCLETGFLRFGNLVTADMHNYCGLGAIDATRTGERFATMELGVRAHIQHLHAYGSTRQLKGDLIDRRYKYVQPRGKAKDIYGLASTWAADLEYGKKLEKLISVLETF